MSDDTMDRIQEPARETADRPVDLGLSEGKALTFSPTAIAVPMTTPAVGGITPTPVTPEPAATNSVAQVQSAPPSVESES